MRFTCVLFFLGGGERAFIEAETLGLEIVSGVPYLGARSLLNESRSLKL